MAMRETPLCLALGFFVIAGAAPLRAQYAPAPETYTVTETNAMFGPSETMKVYRDGSKAVVDIMPPATPGSGVTPVRTLYDLQAHTSISWDPTISAAQCGQGTFSGDWGDPFAGSADMAADLKKQGAKKTGAESIDGFSTDVYEATDATSHITFTAWIDTKYGLVVKLQSAGKTLTEITQLIVAPPAASLFALPAACSNLPPMVSEPDRIAAETNSKAGDYVDAGMPSDQPPTTSCTAVFKVVQAGTMKPVAIHYAIGLDLDQNSNGGYNVDVGLAGTAKFSGGAIKDVSTQIHNGVLRIPNVPKHFYMDVEFGDAGSASGLLYRQCFGAETTLVLVLKNPDKLSDGADWLWSKTGK
ncbi:MAG: hypothetical protein WA871_10175 [Candidatus Acidiferrales bacterium]